MHPAIEAPGYDVSTRTLVLRVLSTIPFLIWAYYVYTSWSDPYFGLTQSLLALVLAVPFGIVGVATVRKPIPRWALGLAIFLGAGILTAAALMCVFGLRSDFRNNPTDAIPFLLALVLSAAYIWAANSIYSRIHGNRRHPRLQGVILTALVTLVAIAVILPNMLRSCCVIGNDGSAVGSLRTVNTAEVIYSSTYPDVGFTELKNLGGPGNSKTGAGLIDNVLAGGSKSGYNFEVSVVPGAPAKSYTVTAVPKDKQSGVRAYCSDQSGVIKYSEKHDPDTCLKSGVPLQ